MLDPQIRFGRGLAANSPAPSKAEAHSAKAKQAAKEAKAARAGYQNYRRASNAYEKAAKADRRARKAEERATAAADNLKLMSEMRFKPGTGNSASSEDTGSAFKLMTAKDDHAPKNGDKALRKFLKGLHELTSPEAYQKAEAAQKATQKQFDRLDRAADKKWDTYASIRAAAYDSVTGNDNIVDYNTMLEKHNSPAILGLLAEAHTMFENPEAYVDRYHSQSVRDSAKFDRQRAVDRVKLKASLQIEYYLSLLEGANGNFSPYEYGIRLNNNDDLFEIRNGRPSQDALDKGKYTLAGYVPLDGEHPVNFHGAVARNIAKEAPLGRLALFLNRTGNLRNAAYDYSEAYRQKYHTKTPNGAQASPGTQPNPTPPNPSPPPGGLGARFKTRATQATAAAWATVTGFSQQLTQRYKENQTVRAAKKADAKALRNLRLSDAERTAALNGLTLDTMTMADYRKAIMEAANVRFDNTASAEDKAKAARRVVALAEHLDALSKKPPTDPARKAFSASAFETPVDLIGTTIFGLPVAGEPSIVEAINVAKRTIHEARKSTSATATQAATPVAETHSASVTPAPTAEAQPADAPPTPTADTLIVSDSTNEKLSAQQKAGLKQVVKQLNDATTPEELEERYAANRLTDYPSFVQTALKAKYEACKAQFKNKAKSASTSTPGNITAAKTDGNTVLIETPHTTAPSQESREVIALIDYIISTDPSHPQFARETKRLYRQIPGKDTPPLANYITNCHKSLLDDPETYCDRPLNNAAFNIVPSLTTGDIRPITQKATTPTPTESSDLKTDTATVGNNKKPQLNLVQERNTKRALRELATASDPDELERAYQVEREILESLNVPDATIKAFDAKYEKQKARFNQPNATDTTTTEALPPATPSTENVQPAGGDDNVDAGKKVVVTHQAIGQVAEAENTTATGNGYEEYYEIQAELENPRGRGPDRRGRIKNKHGRKRKTPKPLHSAPQDTPASEGVNPFAVSPDDDKPEGARNRRGWTHGTPGKHS